jgi:DNA mismatch repair ATPase MutS
MLKKFEKRNFDSPYINDLKRKIQNSNGLPAYKQLEKLHKLTDSIKNRHNAIYIVLNLLFLRDYSRMFKLQSWKSAYGHKLQDWFETLGELEALSSLSIIVHDNPDWTTPIITKDEKNLYTAKDIGHPLLGKSCVKNDISIKPPLRCLLITGSNMSGKSTYLRTSGLNLVLAYAGTTVKATSFHASLMDVHTCMRVSDNLEKGISSFYAEILRIKTIVEKVKSNESVFFLLDEIFKGTNSMDRHTGAKALIKNTISNSAIGLVSTHDLELAELEDGDSRVRNYHFEEYYKNNEIAFDYKLLDGVSKKRNAIFLMKMAGIDFESQDARSKPND